MSRHYNVTHVDAQGVRRRLVISAPSRDLAWAFAEQLYGMPRYLSAVRV